MPKEKVGSVVVPPKLFKRNEYGLIEDASINYVFNEDGTINWRKMIKPEFLVPNKQVFQRRNKPIPETVEGLEDNELLILLGGIKELAQIRGFSAVLPYKVTSPSNDYVIAVASIVWLPNYETSDREVQFSAIGDASAANTNGFGRNYLGPIAENRAFVRCVRNFLKINIVSQEEVGPNAAEDSVENTHVNLLKTLMDKHGITFDTIKKKLVEEKLDGAEEFTSINQIPKFKTYELIERIKNKVSEKR
jgi:hypothetical protein